MPPKRTHLQSPNPVKQQMLNIAADDSENSDVNVVIATDDAIQAPPSTPTLSPPMPPVPATEAAHFD